MKKIKNIFRVGDTVRHENKKYIVSGTKGWIHKGGWISICQRIGEISLLTRIEKVKLILPREKIKGRWWAIFPKGEK